MASVSVPEPDPSPTASHAAPREAWILAGVLDGRAAAPALGEDVAGLPHLFRLAGELQMAGVARALLAKLTADRRLAKISIEVATEVPAGAAGDSIVVVRGDRIFHRDLPKAAITAWTGSQARLAKVAGDEHDAVLVTDRATAT